ncbi:unnamed protein product [Kluyveromyces dobzhanskii CBS 2104]|uniref:WGS project CCBQ000000000 data, contig 00106 n=1 Tax=Kluyveromyces dobzhanskii CBS 2104 TaxID=1427455 RepID=A0A0A8L8A8_9SACH|nr:unnamed protein product [Kluyveromyces dobzhanskii CBS 2104]
MAVKKALTEILGIKYPILLAPMAGVSTPELAATVSNAGGLGSLGLGSSSVEKAKSAIIATQKLTKKPFQVNFFCHEPQEVNVEAASKWIDFLKPVFVQFDSEPKQNLTKIYKSFLEDPQMLELVLELKPDVISFHFGVPPQSTVEKLKRTGIITMASVTQLSEAQIAVARGIDILIAQGVEAGGHRGIFSTEVDPALTTKDLVALLQSKLGADEHVPIVAAGGVMSGQDIRELIDLGACGAQLGTAFVQCKESAASVNYKQSLLGQNKDGATQITSSVSGRPARALISSWHTKVDVPGRPPHPGYPYTYDVGKQLNELASSQESVSPDRFNAHWAGSNVRRIRDLDANKLMQTLIREMS